MAQLINQNEIIPVGLGGDSSSSNVLAISLNTTGPVGDNHSQSHQIASDDAPRNKPVPEPQTISSHDESTENVEETAPAGADCGDRDLADEGNPDDRSSSRQYASKRPQAFKAVSVTKSFLAKSGSGLNSPLKSATDRGMDQVFSWLDHSMEANIWVQQGRQHLRFYQVPDPAWLRK